MSQIQETHVFVSAQRADHNLADDISPEEATKVINEVHGWASLAGKHVMVLRGGQLVREGRVETVSHDSRMIWLESFGTDPRRLFDLAEGYEVRVRLDAFESNNSVSRPS